MTNHYYSKNPDVESNPSYWEFTLRGKAFRFKTDNGVFSKKEVDFGSRLLIDTVTEPEVDGPILDVGCGYGPIGLSMAFSFPERAIEMVDVNERAIQLSRENAEANRITNVDVYESDVFSQVKETAYAAILTNPPIRAGKKVVHEILEKSYDRLASGGELWVVIQKKQGAPSAMDKMETVFGNVDVAAKKKGYYILVAKKV
ncbi:class I SAM-dependent methyltransferase [Bacillus testis]|uniref:class I SAM-dependent methyltransferase n=1 Tax=Bacillus testis TaxID=1622072 RepID=UPI00067F6A7D|nr:class I SAM-dependent methyltransferase [Bacillus testis]